jgi:nucleotide-binding universal stress UspA family protein
MRIDAEAGAPVVVGIDGSASSLTAVDLAAAEAHLRTRALRIVHAYPWPYGPHVGHHRGGDLDNSAAGSLEDAAREQAEQILATATGRARAVAPELEVHGEIVVESAAAVLVRASRHAVMVVVGDRGIGGFAGLVVGSVAVQLSAHAHCPVVVARGALERAGDVLVGVDGSPAGDEAVAFAFAEAALRGVGLVALHAWTHPVSVGPGDMLPLVYDVSETESGEARLLAESVSGSRDRYPEVDVRHVLVRGRAAHALVDASSKAQLVVVGSRGHGGFTGLLMGSVSQAVLHHAACPVAVVRATGAAE